MHGCKYCVWIGVSNNYLNPRSNNYPSIFKTSSVIKIFIYSVFFFLWMSRICAWRNFFFSSFLWCDLKLITFPTCGIGSRICVLSILHFLNYSTSNFQPYPYQVYVKCDWCEKLLLVFLLHTILILLRIIFFNYKYDSLSDLGSNSVNRLSVSGASNSM